MRVISVTSGKGGVGKSTFCLNLGIALTMNSRRVVVLDGDLGLANLDIMAGVTPTYTLQHVVAGQKELHEIITDGPGGIGIIGGGSAIHSLMHAGKKRLSTFLSQFDQLSQHVDYMIIDTSAGIENRMFEFLGMANDIIVVSNSEPTSITDSYAVVKVCTKKKIVAPIHVVANSVKRDEEGPAIFNALAQVSQVFLDRDLFFLGSVHYDPSVPQSIRKQTPCILSNPKCPAVGDIQTIAARVLSWGMVQRSQSMEETIIDLFPDADTKIA